MKKIDYKDFKRYGDLRGDELENIINIETIYDPDGENYFFRVWYWGD